MVYNFIAEDFNNNEYTNTHDCAAARLARRVTDNPKVTCGPFSVNRPSTKKEIEKSSLYTTIMGTFGIVTLNGRCINSDDSEEFNSDHFELIREAFENDTNTTATLEILWRDNEGPRE